MLLLLSFCFRRPALRSIGWVGLLCTALIGGPATAETPVARGDTLFVSVTGAPELTRDARVDVDGRIRLPLVGGIDVAGLDIDTIQARIAQALVSRDILRDPVVLVEVSQYRPVYVGGTVKKNGEVPFQPGLTVRQAIITAGGVDAAIEDKAPGLGQILELLARQRSAADSLQDLDSKIARLKLQLEELKPDAVEPAKDGSATVQSVDAALLDDLMAQRSADRDYAEKATALTDVELDVLSQLAAHQADERALQKAEVESMRTLVERGLAPLSRLQELEREESRLARDYLENQTFTARARQGRVTIMHSTEATLTAQRIAAREALRAALGDRAALVTELEVLQGHLLAAGRMPATEAGSAVVQPVIVVHRNVDGTSHTLAATMETEIIPGDVVDVSLPLATPGG